MTLLVVLGFVSFRGVILNCTIQRQNLRLYIAPSRMWLLGACLVPFCVFVVVVHIAVSGHAGHSSTVTFLYQQNWITQCSVRLLLCCECRRVHRE